MALAKGKRRLGGNATGRGTDRWSKRTTFVGFDWAGDHHDLVVVDRHGKVVDEFRFDDTAAGWQLLIKKLREHPDPAVVDHPLEDRADEKAE